MRNRIKYSQNFLADSQLVRDSLNKSGISKEDTVIEIGAGDGIITQELVKRSKKVIAFELDGDYFKKLSEKFTNEKSLELKQEDFLNSNLPAYPYKVFSNIPFNITAGIVKKLTLEDNPPEDAYLIVQKEAGAKFAGKPLDSKNQQMAVILYPWFEFKVIYEFKPSDFFPKPNVNIILLRIKKRSNPLVADKNKYEDFVTYSFNQPKQSILPTNSKPSEIDFEDWISLFESFLNASEKQQNTVKDSFAKQLKQQESLAKIHRTRLDEDWTKF